MQRFPFTRTVLCVFVSSVLASMTVHAQEKKSEVKNQQEVTQEEIVTVRETRSNDLTSVQHITREEIQTRVNTDGNITDLLRNNPAVQFSNQSQNSLTMGEIKPSDISIHGSLAYQNHFLLDGTSINSDLDPATGANNTIAQLQGSDEQGFYIDSRLLEGVTVYDHNIPVRFGGFTGGVVDANTRSWTGKNSIRVFTRTSHGSWGRLIVDPSLLADGVKNDASAPARYQKDFKKTTYGFSGEWGLTDSVGIVVGYTRRESEIPLEDYPGAVITIPGYTEDEWSYTPTLEVTPTDGRMKTQKRVSDNLFTKISAFVDDTTEADLSFNYSGSQAKMFLPGIARSDYKDDHDGYNVTFNLNRQYESVKWRNTLAYSHMVDRRRSDSQTLIDLIQMDENFNMSQFQTGGYGNLESKQDVYSAKTKWTWDPIYTAENISHQWTTGFDITSTRGTYVRKKDLYQYQLQNTPGGVWGNTTWWKAGEYDANLDQVAWYGQHLLQIDRVSLRSGVRLDYDSFSKDVNWAPRFTAHWDVFGTQQTVLTAGANRYYGRNLLAYAIMQGQQNGIYTTSEYVPEGKDPIANEWTTKTGSAAFDNLRTPYSDEFSLGLTQRYQDWMGQLTYVHRNGKDEILGHQNGNSQRWYSNDGTSEHDSVILSINNTTPLRWAKADHYIRAALTWEQTQTNVPMDLGYSDNNGINLDTNYAYLDGKLVKAEDIDGTDFNIPWKFFVETTHQWHSYGVTWHNMFTWHSQRDQAIRDGERYAGRGENRVSYANYQTHHFASTWTWDTKVQYQPDWARGVGVALEVTNILNNRNVIDVARYSDADFKTRQYNLYQAGRQFWVEMSYEF